LVGRLLPMRVLRGLIEIRHLLIQRILNGVALGTSVGGSKVNNGSLVPASRGTGCSAVNNLVSFTSQWRTGVGALDHEVVVSITNNAEFPVSVTVRYHKNGLYDPNSDGEVDINPGQTQGGEYQGLWDSGDDSSAVQYMAYRKDSTDTQANSCIGLPW
jgi:hypothetical protein